jgi:hypothetical protein
MSIDAKDLRIARLENMLRVAREHLIRVRDNGINEQTEKVIDSAWDCLNFDGYPKPIDQWGDGVAECQDWKDT